MVLYLFHVDYLCFKMITSLNGCVGKLRAGKGEVSVYTTGARIR